MDITAAINVSKNRVDREYFGWHSVPVSSFDYELHKNVQEERPERILYGLLRNVPSENDRWMSHYSDYCPIAEKGGKKEHLNPFGWGNSVAGHYIEDGTR